MKFELWETKAKDCSIDMFESFSYNSNNAAADNKIKEMMYSLLQKHLRCLRNESNRFSPDLNYLDTKFVRNPFNIDVASLPDSLLEDFMDFTKTQ